MNIALTTIVGLIIFIGSAVVIFKFNKNLEFKKLYAVMVIVGTVVFVGSIKNQTEDWRVHNAPYIALNSEIEHAKNVEKLQKSFESVQAGINKNYPDQK